MPVVTNMFRYNSKRPAFTEPERFSDNRYTGSGLYTVSDFCPQALRGDILVWREGMRQDTGARSQNYFLSIGNRQLIMKNSEQA
jgi:hypothetical protein